MIDCLQCIFGATIQSVLLVAAVVALAVYHLIVRDWNHFSDRNVPYLREWSLTRTMWQLLFAPGRQRTVTQLIQHWYSAPPADSPVVGVWDMAGQPIFVVRSPELIKRITIKDVDHFRNHRFAIDERCDPIVGRTLFFMKNERWQQMRPTLSPLFTGHKMRIMHAIIDAKSRQFVEHVATMAEGAEGTVELEMKDTFTRYANDVIASCAFGMEVNSLQRRDNEFYTMGREVGNFEGVRGFGMMMCVMYPRLAQFFRVRILSEARCRFFTDAVLAVVGYRRANGVVKEDIVDLLMRLTDELSEQNRAKADTDKIKWTDDDLVAQCLGFFLAGYDPVSNLMSFMAHELAVNPEVQRRLYEEIAQHKTLEEMPYLDAVCAETLRLWTPTPMTDRACNRAYDVPLDDQPNGPMLRLQPGDVVTIPIHAIHMDAKYYADPGRFWPERFLGGRKAEYMAAGTFLPFGSGQRNCLGSRFALLEAKLAIVRLLERFSLERSERTQVPLRLRPMSFSMLTERGMWISLRKRSD